MKMNFHLNWKRTLFIVLDVLLAVYLGFAMTTLNRPDEKDKICSKVSISIDDDNMNGFLSANEVKTILTKQKLYPYEQPLSQVNPRQIEDFLKQSPFVKTAECCKMQNGHVNITITQQLPILRIKSNNGEDYYVDASGGILPNSKYTSDLIIATGEISRAFAKNSLSCLAKTIDASNFWHNQIEQINILPDHGVEIVPRVGDHIIFLGYLPQMKTYSEQQRAISESVTAKLERLEKFYKYGLSQAGWNRYHYISVEFDNQIICKKNFYKPTAKPVVKPVETPTAPETAAPPAGEQENSSSAAASTTSNPPPGGRGANASSSTGATNSSKPSTPPAKGKSGAQ